MNQAIKERWVKALRSGEYAQGLGALRSDGKFFCCWGVLCELASADGLGAWRDGSSAVFRAASGCESGGLPPTAIFTWADIGFGDKIEIAGVLDYPQAHNDAGRTFAEIADAIEAQL